MCLDQVLLHLRFSVSQTRSDGSVKIRPVDHFSWSGCDRQKENSVNGHTAPREKLSHETLDELAVAMKHFVGAVGETPGLVKADIDAAFRRVPIRPDHRWAAGIAFRVGLQVRDVGYCAPSRAFLCHRFFAQFMPHVRSAQSDLCTRRSELVLQSRTSRGTFSNSRFCGTWTITLVPSGPHV